ncbi:MAG: isoprenylcysteine carboxylmethyltransferase family protein [Pyrinomonadaceae bacterium]
MSTSFDLLPTLVFAVVMLCWVAFAATLLLRKKIPSAPDRRRDSGSNLGLVLQCVSYAIVWLTHRPAFTPIVIANEVVAAGLGLTAVVAAVASVWLIMAAVKTLGREWSITARVLEGHKLATGGPYAYVRHPIYSGMLGMLLATALAISNLVTLPIALVVFFVGTMIRVRSEEKLLREAFGNEFDDYASRVHAIIPALY